jgi:hypothetical protein
LTDEQAPLPPAPPPPPRELTPAIRRRAWNERHVRFWWVTGVVLLLIATYYAGSRYYVWAREKHLIEHGTAVQAEVMGANPNADAPRGQVYTADTAVDLKYSYNGQSYRQHGQLDGRTQQIFSRTSVPLMIDPSNPDHWTGRTRAASLIHQMLSAMLLLPIAIVLLALAIYRRAQVLGIYRHGEEIIAEVVGEAHSAAHPLSRLLKCGVRADSRVVTVLLPARIAPRVGEALWLIAPPNRPDKAIPAALFE